FRGVNTPVWAVNETSFDGVQIAFFSAGSEASLQWAPAAVKKGAVVVDNSSAFRMSPESPLVIPEINWQHVLPEHRIFPVGNCTAIILMMAVAPLRRFGKLKRLVISTYQSASGAGARAMQELLDQCRDVLDGREPVPQVFPHPTAFNLFSHNTPINAEGYNGEEWKVIQETRKTLDAPDLRIEVTCVRVPVMRAHSLTANVEFDGPAPSVEAMKEAYEAFSGVELVDDRAANCFPMPSLAATRDEVLVGRLRRDNSNPNAVSLFACGDQLRKGAALNGIQIAERLVAEGKV
ncbi:MAG: aspartate-semialdehyde dehydrogenase, partial [Armatimonadetes bacterium]|nr:aspartate-semialdehyde dehydrogenase [Armatimonadota bacterium]